MKSNKGFTLIELIMVTIILGILAAVAIPRYMESVKQAEMAAEDAVRGSLPEDSRRIHPFGIRGKPGGWTSVCRRSIITTPKTATLALEAWHFVRW